jgi:diguanylate cyclase (GGDEF)-like protein
VVIVLGTGAAVILVALRAAGLLKSLAASRDALTHESTHDSLTGIANRTLFSRRLTDVLTEGRRCSVVLVDLDGFKAVNDELGHLVGDALLIEAAHRLTRAVRTGDLVARFGGDEFAVLLPDTTPEVAQRVTDRVAELLNADVVVRGHQTALRASVGLANWDASSAGRVEPASPDVAEVDGIDRLLAAADRAMYQAKRQRARHLVLVHPSALPAEILTDGVAEHDAPSDPSGTGEPAAATASGHDQSWSA